MNTNTMPLEAETRILIDRSLENLGWKLNGKEQNVFKNSPELKLKKRNLVVKDLTMFFIPRKVTNLLS